MLHAHVETLFYHWIFQIYVWARSYRHVCTDLMIVGSKTSWLESSLLRVEDGLELLQRLCPWLLERARSHLFLSGILVLGLRYGLNLLASLEWILSWTWHIKFQALAIEYLIIVESWWSMVKSNVLTWEHFVITSSSLGSPLGPVIFKVILTFFACPL